EAFFGDIKDTINDWRLRRSYGTTGNDLTVAAVKIGQFLYQEKYTQSGGYVFGDRYYNGIMYGANPTQNLTWTTSKSYNLGLEFGLLNNKLSGSIDVFSRKETDILGARNLIVPDKYGRTLAPEDDAACSYGGGEFMLNGNGGAGEVSYGLGGNLGYCKDRWDIYDEAPSCGVGREQNFRSRI